MLRKLQLIAFIAFLLYGASRYSPWHPGTLETGNDTDQILARAFTAQASGLQVEGEGEVIRTLPDDDDGGRHQRFVIRLASAQTVLVAHNIDLAPRIVGLKVGDRILFNGEYEWNSQGGVIHWTHRDPNGRHAAGWIKHRGRQYE
jgi:Protein of unknown function (DUF3465)